MSVYVSMDADTYLCMYISSLHDAGFTSVVWIKFGLKVFGKYISSTLSTGRLLPLIFLRQFVAYFYRIKVAAQYLHLIRYYK